MRALGLSFSAPILYCIIMGMLRLHRLRMIGPLLLAMAVMVGPMMAAAAHAGVVEAPMAAAEDMDAHPCETSGPETGPGTGCPPSFCHAVPVMPAESGPSALPPLTIAVAPADLVLRGLTGKPDLQPPTTNILV